MAPSVRRSWAVRGQPPVLEQEARHREKVSAAAAVWLTPRRDRRGLAYQTPVNGDFSNWEVAEFLQAGLEALDGPLVVVWDRGTMHTGDPIRGPVGQADGRLDIEPLPAHAPELMPVEFLRRSGRSARR